MKRDHIADEAASKELTAPKRGYSIWSLLVIMTLLAVWLAVPVKSGDTTDILTYDLFVIAHQFTFWMSIASLIWLFTGRHRATMLLSTLFILTCLAPWTMRCIESQLTGGFVSTTHQLLSVLKIEEFYFKWAWYVFEVFGYEY